LTDLVDIARELGTTNFKIIDAKTRIIKFETNRQLSRKIQRELDRQTPKPQNIYYPKSVHLVKKT